MQDRTTGSPAAGAGKQLQALFEAKESALLLYAQRLTGNAAAAEDVVQEAFMRLHREYALVQQPVPWLYRTVHNLAVNHVRATQKLTPLQPIEEDDPEWDVADDAPMPDEQLVRLEAIGQTRLCLAALDARQREVLRLKFEEGLSYKEIGARLNLNVGHVGYLLHHALKDLAAALKHTGVL
ncbi:MAG: RNA polymerase sigma factor [Verrucomicrobiae bacterium]|nr:RNA polymerase sigma factor [Verrucomicrobiae bacterium]